MNVWDNSKTRVLVLVGDAGDTTVDMVVPYGKHYRFLSVVALHDGAANRTLQWAVVATDAALVRDGESVAAGARVSLYDGNDWGDCLVLDSEEYVRVSSDILAGEHVTITAVIQCLSGEPN